MKTKHTPYDETECPVCHKLLYENKTCPDTACSSRLDHTPTPWKIIGEPNENGEGVKIESETTVIGEMAGGIPNSEVTANAALIVRAVNSHDEMLRLLKNMTEQIDKHFYKLPEDNENDGKYWKRLYGHALEAITKAEGK